MDVIRTPTTNEALQKLCTATSQKVAQAGDIDLALRLLREVAEADVGPELRALAHYRLGHLEYQRGDLHEADAMFVGASRSRSLGAWPTIFALAMGVRLGARDLAGRLQRATDALGQEDRASSQAHTASALQALAYALDLDASALRGLAPLPNLAPDSLHAVARAIGWPSPDPVRMIWSLADALFEECRHTAVRLHLDGSSLRLEGLPERSIKKATAELLAVTLEEPSAPSDRMAERLDITQEALRVRWTRARADVPELFGSGRGLLGSGLALVDERLLAQVTPR